MKRHITSEEFANISEDIQLFLIQGLQQTTEWDVKDLVFQGGMNLSLVQKSDRKSEDMDFLINKTVRLKDGMERVFDFITHQIQKKYAESIVEIKERQNGQISSFVFGVQLPDVLEKVKIKSEFWSVDKEKLDVYQHDNYRVDFKGHVLNIHAATHEQVFQDKLLALGARPFLKANDIFDLYFLYNQYQSTFKNPSLENEEKLKTTSFLYNTPMTTIVQKWKDFVKQSDIELHEKLQKDLKNRFSVDVYESVSQQIPQMIKDVKNLVSAYIQVYHQPKFSERLELFRQKNPQGQEIPNFSELKK